MAQTTSLSGQESTNVGQEQSPFWDNSVDSNNTTAAATDLLVNGHEVATAGHLVNATEAARLEKDGKHVFFDIADAPKIQRFFKSIVKSGTTMYEGTWVVPDEADEVDPEGMLQAAFASDEVDEFGVQGATTKGRVRTFINRVNLSSQSRAVIDYFTK